MRGARGAQTAKAENGTIWAISLGADYVSEHEHGISVIYQAFGIDVSKIGKAPVGIDSRRVQKFPSSESDHEYNQVFIQDFKIGRKQRGYNGQWGRVGWRGTMLGMIPKYKMEDNLDPTDMYEMYDNVVGDDLKPLTTAWGEGDFAVFARKPEEIQFLKDLHQAFQDGDAAIWLGGGGPFTNSGLCFGIISRMPKKFTDDMKVADDTSILLAKADKATGVKDRLKVASETAPKIGWTKPFEYRSLTPRFVNEFTKNTKRVVDTDYDVLYFLNPRQQKTAHHGWFSVEQLDQWIAGTGPILKEMEVA